MVLNPVCGLIQQVLPHIPYKTIEIGKHKGYNSEHRKKVK